MNHTVHNSEGSPTQLAKWDFIVTRSTETWWRGLRPKPASSQTAVGFLMLLLVLVLCPLQLHAQAGAANGAISGTVYDSGKSVVPGAQITAKNLDTGFTRTVASSPDGDYSLPLLPLGEYSITVEKTGFSRLVQTGITVEPSRSTPLPLVLSIASGSETVQVNADAANISTESQVEIYVPQLTVENMPLTSRNLWNIPSFSPAVATTPNQSFGSPAYAFGGIERRGYVVDGMDDTQRAGQSKLAMFPSGAMQEVSVLQGSLLPEYGSTLGGLVFQTSRSGTNKYHGSLLDLERRPGLIAKPALLKPGATKPFQERATREVTFGGPIVKNKWWGFADFELDPQTAPVPITISAANAALLNIPASDLGSAPVVSKYKMWLARTDFQINQKNSGFVRVDYFGVPIAYNTNGGTMPLSTDNNYYDQDISGVAQFQTILSSRAVNEFRFADNRRLNYSKPVNGTIGYVAVITGVANLNSNTSAGQTFFEHQDEFVDNFSLQHGKHTFKVGFMFETVNNNIHNRLTDTFTFASVATYLSTLSGATPTGYAQLTQQFGDNTGAFRDNYLGLYAQDQWKLQPNLMFTYGLRYDLIFYPSLSQNAPIAQSRTIPDDKKNFSPRLGVAWQPDSKTSIRAGYSILYDFTDLQFVNDAVTGNGLAVQTYQVAGTTVGAPAFPTGFTAPPSSGAVVPNIAGFDPNFKTYYSHQANLIVDRDLGRGFALQGGYLFYLGRRAPLFEDNNLPQVTGQLADGRPTYSGPRPNANFKQIALVTSAGSSSYNGGYLNLTKRLTQGLEFSAAYTYAHAINNTDADTDTIGAAGFPSNPANLNFDRGRSSADIRNRFTLQGVWKPIIHANSMTNAVINGWMLAPAVTLYTGYPVNPVLPTDLNGDGNLNDRPLFVGRNTVTGRGFHEVDLRLSRTFPLGDKVHFEAIIQAENLLNSLNVSCNVAVGCSGAVGNNPLATTYLIPTGAYDSRQVELGARLSF
jgi:hypothetical protein